MAFYAVYYKTPDRSRRNRQTLKSPEIPLLYKIAKLGQVAQNELVIFVQDAILLFPRDSCILKPEKEGGHNSRLPGKWDRVSAAEDHNQGTLQQ